MFKKLFVTMVLLVTLSIATFPKHANAGLYFMEHGYRYDQSLPTTVGVLFTSAGGAIAILGGANAQRF